MIIAGAVLGVFLGGRMKNMLSIKLEKVWLILLAFVIQVFLQIMAKKGIEFSTGVVLLTQGLSYASLLLTFWFNRRYLGVLIMGAGCMANAVVIMLNGGRMPVSVKILERAGLQQGVEILRAGLDAKHAVLGAGTRLSFLADVIYMPGFPGMLMRIVSVGDLITAAGLFLLVFELVTGRMLRELEVFNSERIN